MVPGLAELAELAELGGLVIGAITPIGWGADRAAIELHQPGRGIGGTRGADCAIAMPPAERVLYPGGTAKLAGHPIS